MNAFNACSLQHLKNYLAASNLNECDLKILLNHVGCRRILKHFEIFLLMLLFA